MAKTTNKYTSEVRERAVRKVLEGAGQHESRWAANVSISSKFGCAYVHFSEQLHKTQRFTFEIEDVIRSRPLY